jgi:hypothetical protein
VTPTQRRDFDESGLLRLPGAISEADVERLRERVWRACARVTVPRGRFLTEILAAGKLSGEIERSGGFPSSPRPASSPCSTRSFGAGASGCRTAGACRS